MEAMRSSNVEPSFRKSHPAWQTTSMCHARRVWSELINRDSVSSNSVKARRDLLHAMINAEGQERLGIQGLPGRSGGFSTRCCLATDLYTSSWVILGGFAPPTDSSGEGFAMLGRATRAMFCRMPTPRVGVQRIYRGMGAASFWGKLGVHAGHPGRPSRSAHKANIAVYKDGMFTPGSATPTSTNACKIQSRFTLRWIAIDEDKNRILERNLQAARLRSARRHGGSRPARSRARPRGHGLQPARVVAGLIALARRPRPCGTCCSRQAIRTKSCSSTWLPCWAQPMASPTSKSCARRCRSSPPPIRKMLGEVEAKLLDALDATREDLESLRERAESMAGVAGNFRLRRIRDAPGLLRWLPRVP